MGDRVRGRRYIVAVRMHGFVRVFVRDRSSTSTNNVEGVEIVVSENFSGRHLYPVARIVHDALQRRGKLMKADFLRSLVSTWRCRVQIGGALRVSLPQGPLALDPARKHFVRMLKGGELVTEFSHRSHVG